MDIVVGTGPNYYVFVGVMRLPRQVPRSSLENHLEKPRDPDGDSINLPLARLLLGAMALDPSVLVNRIRSEFNEMPGLQLTLPQAARLWGLEMPVCRDVIDALIETSFLRWTPKGTIVRLDPSGAPRASLR